jgi:hypothetical protein
MEHRILASARDGSEILSAIALVRAGLYDRSAKRFVAVERMFEAAGVAAVPAPVPTPRSRPSSPPRRR